MTKTALIVLGHRLKDDGSISDILRKRLDITKQGVKIFLPDIIITSGGVANKKALISEAFKMKEMLVSEGLDEKMIIIEDKSKSTFDNALYSVKICKDNNINRIIVVTSIDHYNHSLSSIFSSCLKDYKTELIFYTNNY